jgi:transglutaminase-like putative cysteine protease
VRHALKILWIAIVVTTPVLGVWVASSLAAFENGPVWAVVLAGLVLFPLGPAAWEGWSEWRRARRVYAKPHILTLLDRIILRTLAINVVFLVGLLATHPKSAFGAISTRGDWFLDGRHGARAEAVRGRLFGAAAALVWLYAAANDNPYRDGREKIDPTAGTGTARGAGSATGVGSATSVPVASGGGTSTPPSTTATTTTSAPAYPQPGTLHPAVVNVPPEAEASIASVARWVVEHEKDPTQQVRALHDWVADRIAYDGVAYVTRNHPPQDAETVFRTRRGVCAGYAYLLAALGKAAGREIVYVTGDARTEGMAVTGEGHAWNAARLEGRWYLIDSTWDAGYLEGDKFTKKFRSDYLFTPPGAFGVDHFPDDARWQLLDQPIARGEFFRQPMMSPRFFSEGFELVEPNRSQVSAHGAIEVTIKNPRGLFLLASTTPSGVTGARSGTSCTVDKLAQRGPDGAMRLRCSFAAPGRYDLHLFSNAAEFGSYAYVGQLGVNAD